MSSPPPLPAQNPPPKQGMNGCLLAALIIVPIFVILGIVAGAALPALNGARQSGLRAKSASNMRSIALAARTYAADYNDEFPKDHKGNPFTSSQEAFNTLVPDYIDTEQVFWFATKEPDHLHPPSEDGELTKGECIYGYVSGQNTNSYSYSPLVFEGFLNKDLSCSEFMPWLGKRKTVVAFVDGHVEQLPLTSSNPGATIQNRERTVKNIFLERDKGGQLDTSPDNVHLPIGY